MKKYVLYFKGNEEFHADMCYNIREVHEVFIANSKDQLLHYRDCLIKYAGTDKSDYIIYELVPSGLD